MSVDSLRPSRPFRFLFLVGVFLNICLIATFAFAQGQACDFIASDESSLNHAISCVNSAGSGEHTIDVLADISLITSTSPIDNTSGGVTVRGNGHTITGQSIPNVRIFEISAGSQVTMANITVTGGNAITGAGFLVTGALELEQVIVTSNHAGERGGGFYVEDSASVEMFESILSNNSAANEGGAGYSDRGSLVANRSTISGNIASYGGAFYNFDGSLSVLESTVNGNQATSAGGGAYINDAGILLKASIFNDNSAPDGGAIAVVAGSVAFIDSTLSGNSATNGGAVHIHSSMGDIINVTIAENEAAQGGGLFAWDSEVTIDSTILTTQTVGASCVVSGTGGFVSAGYNIDSDESCNLAEATDLPAGNANLGSLSDNGGPTKTHAIGIDSDAVERGNDEYCDAEGGSDQRDVFRPQAIHCDIGAFELELEHFELLANCGGYDVYRTPLGELYAEGWGSNILAGTVGSDTIVGTDAPDLIVGLGGNDIIDGKSGEDVLCGGLGDDELLGGQQNDLLEGNDGNDDLNGQIGDDVLSGGPDNDTLNGGPGTDECDGGTGSDQLQWCETTGAIIMRMETIPDGSLQQFDYSISGPDDSIHGSLADGESVRVDDATQGAWELAETIGSLSWNLDSITCSSLSGASTWFPDLGAHNVTVDLAWVDTVECVFTNKEQAPLAVTLNWFLAEADRDTMYFRWQTATEMGTAGFNILYSTEAGSVQLNSELISSPVIDALTPTDYVVSLHSMAKRFYLQEVSINGHLTEYGPFEVGEVYGSFAEPNAASFAPNIWLPIIVR